MGIELAYGDSKIDLEIPAGISVDVFSPDHVEQAVGYDQFRDDFLRMGGEAVLLGEPSLVIVNDGYRNTPTATILEWLDHIDKRFLDGARFMVATGVHQSPTKEHYRKIFGRFLAHLKDRVEAHDARDHTSLVKVGTDHLGGDVWLNRAVDRNRKLLVIGSVEPHYFAGYTGGRKSIFPGLTDMATVERNHNLANRLDAAPLKLKGNPVSEHLDELMSVLDQDKLFGIQAVMYARDGIAGVFSGRLDVAFEKAARLAERIFSKRVERQYDLVICEVLPPLDANLYQLQKALENCQAAVKDGGTVILLSVCEEGIGSRHFFDLAKTWDRDRNAPADGKLRFGSHKLSRVNAIGTRINVYLHSSLPGEVVRQVFYEPLDNVQKFLFLNLVRSKASSLAIVHDAGNTVLTT